MALTLSVLACKQNVFKSRVIGTAVVVLLDVVSSIPCKLAGCLSPLHTSVHWQDFVEAKKFCDVLLILPQNVIVESS